MIVKELIGLPSLRAFNVFHKLMLGIKMIPAYAHLSYETFLNLVQSMPPEDQEKVIREAVIFVDLEPEEVQAVAKFCADKNGISFGPEQLKSLPPDQLVEVIVAVCKEISKIKIDLISEDEKKNSKTSASI